MSPGQRCENYNHGRPNAPVRHCPSCGGVVNQNLPIKKCTQNEHAKTRSERNRFCLDCGEELIMGSA